MVPQKLREYLDSRNIRYSVISHTPTFTAQETATIAHIPGKEIAKTVIVKIDGRMTMVVLPASEMVDLKSLRKAFGAVTVELAHEEEFGSVFGECEAGAMPPFGNLYGMDVVVSTDLTEDRDIAFNAGTHRELVRMAYADFDRLVRPKLVAVGVPRKTREQIGWDYDG
jgi:Ala-tRNA(Pro) deacylase